MLLPAYAFAQSVFNGTWKLDPTTVHMVGGKAMVVTLHNGMFSRSTAQPAFKVKADGKDHAVRGHKQFDTVAVAVINNHSIRETDKKAGKVVAVTNVVVAPNGKTATVKMDRPGRANHFAGTELVDRVGKPKAGSNTVTGSWRLDRVVAASGSGFAPAYKIVGDTVTETDSNGDLISVEVKPESHDLRRV